MTSRATTHTFAPSMAVSPLKRKQVRIYLDDDDDAMFARLMAGAGKLSEASVMSLIVHAGLKAIEANGFRVEIPFRLEVHQTPLLLNEKNPAVATAAPACR